MVEQKEQTGPRPVPAPQPSEIVRVQLEPSRRQTAAAIASFLVALFTLGTVIVLAFQLYGAQVEFEDFKRGRRADRIEERYLEFYSPRMLYSRARAAAEHPKLGLHALRVLDFFERLARDRKHGVLETDDIIYSFEITAPLYWCGWKDAIKQRREDRGQHPDTGEPYQGLQGLFVSMQNGSSDCLDTALIEELLQYEEHRVRAERDYLSYMTIEGLTLADVAGP